jgi:hypothetical protein
MLQVLKLFNIYFFEGEGIPSVLFDKFFQQHFWEITDLDRKVTISKLIHERYQKCVIKHTIRHIKLRLKKREKRMCSYTK